MIAARVVPTGCDTRIRYFLSHVATGLAIDEHIEEVDAGQDFGSGRTDNAMSE
jgi:hypothetical protein